MSVHLSRYKKLKQKQYQSGKILYWMNRDMRLQDNWALLRAQELADMYGVELCVVYNLDTQFLGGTLRQLDFKINALKELHQDFEKHNISFFVLEGSNIQCVIDFIQNNDIGYFVTDFAPLRIQRKWLDTILKKTDIPAEIVDTHNIVPIWEASNKKEFAAYTLRSKINKKLSEFLTDFPKVKKQKSRTMKSSVISTIHSSDVIPAKDSSEYVIPAKAGIKDFKSELDNILQNTKTNREVAPITWCTSGEKSAHKTLANFISHIDEYGEKRNDPVADVQSNLSPYLHYGMIAPQRVAFEINKLHIDQKSKADFLEELIIRRELADNFCYYEPNYDNSKGFHEFFVKEYERIKKVKREYIYSLKKFEHAQTHDELWNACQLQMIKAGKMHGYLRMYWAKMIFAWSKNVNEAMKIALYLNDKYELDGRDPNGYTGIAWCIGGVHDRPWFITNAVFGKLRYMSRSGMDKKFDTKAYIEKWGKESLF